MCVVETTSATCLNSALPLYRKRTIALLKKYFRMSVELGHLPSVMGTEFFRSHVTTYGTNTFEDAVIFVHDVERCLESIHRQYQVVIARLFFQQYTTEEASRLGDYACAEVIEKHSGAQCAELHGHLPPHELAMEVAKLAKEYNDAQVVVERNSIGGEVLGHLERMKLANVSGWTTTAVSRPPAIANLRDLLAEAPELFSSSRLLRECRTFVRQLDGSPRAASGTHDDCVMAMAIAQAVRAEIDG